jgi:hypothetical protein
LCATRHTSKQHKLKWNLTKTKACKATVGGNALSPHGKHKARGMKGSRSGEQATCPRVGILPSTFCSMIERIHFDIDNVKRPSYTHEAGYVWKSVYTPAYRLESALLKAHCCFHNYARPISRPAISHVISIKDAVAEALLAYARPLFVRLLQVMSHKPVYLFEREVPHSRPPGY